MRQQRVSKVHEDKYLLEHREKDELVKQDMLDPPRYLRRSKDIRGKALSFGVLDWDQFENWKESASSTAEGSKGVCCSYASSYNGSVETASSSLELDLSTGVVKRLEQDLKPQINMGNDRFSLRSESYSDAMNEKGKLDHKPRSRKHKEHRAYLDKYLVEKEDCNASELSSCVSPPCPHIFSRQINTRSETSSKLLPEAFRTVECHDDVEGECSSPVNEISKNGRHGSPNRRFSFSFSQMGRSFSSKESSSSIHASSSVSHASAKSGPLTSTPSTSTKPNSGHNRTRSCTLLKPKTEKNVPVQVSLKPSNARPQTMEKNSRSQALLQYTLRKGINLFQFVVDNNSNNVLAATMKSSDSSTRSYTLYSVNEVKNKSGNWLNRHRNDPFVHTIIGHMKTVSSFTSDLATHISESVLFGVENNEEEVAAIVQTGNKSQKHYTTSIILPSGVHTLPKDGNAPLPLIDRWKHGCDCGGWDLGCKLRVLSNDHIKSFTSFQLFDQERDGPTFKMVRHDNELHSVEYGSSISVLEAFFISLATVSSHQSWYEEEEEEEAVVIGDFALKTEKSTKYASNPPVSPIGRV